MQDLLPFVPTSCASGLAGIQSNVMLLDIVIGIHFSATCITKFVYELCYVIVFERHRLNKVQPLAGMSAWTEF